MFWNRKRPTSIAPKEEKIIVIGGGVSGLFSGIHGLKKGYNVTIIEKENILGGKLSISKYNDYPFIIYGKDEFNSLLNEIGIDLFDVDNNYKLSIYTNDCYYQIPNNIEQFETMLFSYSIDDDKYIKEFINDIKQAQKTKVLYEAPYEYLSFMQKNKQSSNSGIIEKLTNKYNKISIKKYITNIHSKHIINIFSNIIPTDLTVSSLIFYLGNYFNNNIKVLNIDLINTLRSVFLDLGGKLLLNKEVVELQYDYMNHVSSALLSDKSIIDGDYFVCSCDPKHCYEKLLKGKFKNRKFYMRYEDYMTYEVDNKMIIKFSLNKPFEYDQINLNVEGLKVNTTNINYLIFKKVEDSNYLYCELKQNFNDFDYIKVLKQKGYLNDNDKKIVKEIIKIFNNNFSNYNINVVESINSIDIENKFYCYRGYFEGYIDKPNINKIIVDGKIDGLKNVFLAPSILSSSGGILNAMITGKFSIYNIKKGR